MSASALGRKSLVTAAKPAPFGNPVKAQNGGICPTEKSYRQYCRYVPVYENHGHKVVVTPIKTSSKRSVLDRYVCTRYVRIILSTSKIDDDNHLTGMYDSKFGYWYRYSTVPVP